MPRTIAAAMMKDAFTRLAAVGLLAGMAIDRSYMPKPADAEGYHARVRRAAEQAPLRIGDWVGTDIVPSAIAWKMLRPNVYISRLFSNLTTGAQVRLLLVHCRDARDMLYHYPPNCYPHSGSVLRSRRPRDWNLDGLRIAGMEYEFAIGLIGRASSTIVANCMLTPDGSPVRDMNDVWPVAENIQRRFWGIAQIQLIMDASMLPEERDDTFRTIVGGHRSIIDAVLSGAGR